MKMNKIAIIIPKGCQYCRNGKQNRKPKSQRDDIMVILNISPFQFFLKYQMASLCDNIDIPSGLVKRHFRLFDVNNGNYQ